MNITLEVAAGALLFILYWWVLSKLVDVVLEAPRLKQAHWLLVGTLNTCIVFSVSAISKWLFLPYLVMMALMLIEFLLFYRDRFSGALLCTLACSIHVLSVFMMMVSTISIITNTRPYEILSQNDSFIFAGIASFFLLDLVILIVIKLVPLLQVRIINQRREQQWFIIAWMAVNNIFLLYMSVSFSSPRYPIHLATHQVSASIVSLLSLYIVLFFSIKTSMLLGYQEKNAKLEQAIHQEQQFRNSMVKEALASYEINITQNSILQGFEDQYNEMGEQIYNYSDMLLVMSQKLIYPEDVPDFIRIYARDNVLKLFQKGKRELTAEYRRHCETGSYLWVRAVIHLVKDTETEDIKAFIYVKNIDSEKKNQLELQHKAERDPLTGLYNKMITAQLVDKHLTFHKKLTECALFMIDVDNFKEINDRLGHVFGDAVLCELADKLIQIFGGNNIVGRIGGDEFIVFYKNNTSTQHVKEKAAEICRAFHLTYKGMNGEKYTISSSIGISFYPKDGSDFKQLYSHADVALYAAKSEGKNTYKIYDGRSFTGTTSKRTEIQPLGNISQKGFRQNRIEYIFKILYQSESPAAAIPSALELVARHFSFDRGYIFETSKDGKTTSNTFEWCAQNVTPEIQNLQDIPIEAVATANSHFQKSGTFVLKTLSDLHPVERAVLEPQGIKSMFQFGIFDKTNLLGFIGFDNCRMEAVPTDTEIDEMKTICNILATFFVKQYIDDISSKDLTALQEIMNHLDNYIYVILAETYEVVFMNDKMQKIASDSLNEHLCHQIFRDRETPCEDCPVHKLIHSKADRTVTELDNDKLNIRMKATASLIHWTDGSLACLLDCTDSTNQL